jgi:hypothetical protein
MVLAVSVARWLLRLFSPPFLAQLEGRPRLRRIRGR